MKAIKDGKQTVWVNDARYRKQIYHTHRDCSRAQKADFLKPVAKSKFEHYDECSICENGVETSQTMDERVCDLCGETYKEVATHLRSCSEQ